MPKTVAQWTGVAVTAIIVFGCDMDVFYAMPLGILAGGLATFFISLDDRRRAAAAMAPAPNRLGAVRGN
ncbi:MAG TPA: hypothetical protein VGG69_08640 [Rhizomicrobium sp.]